MSVKRIAAETLSLSGMIAKALKRAMEMALVGPLINWRDESSRAPTAVMTTAVYRPYCGGNPASMAYAIAWGTAIVATVSPAIMSALRERREYVRSDSIA